MAAVIPKLTGFGGAFTSRFSARNLGLILNSIADDLDEVKTKFDGHKHSFDGSQAADSITGVPVTGATTGSATGGTASTVTIGTTKE